MVLLMCIWYLLCPSTISGTGKEIHKTLFQRHASTGQFATLQWDFFIADVPVQRISGAFFDHFLFFFSSKLPLVKQTGFFLVTPFVDVKQNSLINVGWGQNNYFLCMKVISIYEFLL